MKIHNFGHLPVVLGDGSIIEPKPLPGRPKIDKETNLVVYDVEASVNEDDFEKGDIMIFPYWLPVCDDNNCYEGDYMMSPSGALFPSKTMEYNHSDDWLSVTLKSYKHAVSETYIPGFIPQFLSRALSGLFTEEKLVVDLPFLTFTTIHVPGWEFSVLVDGVLLPGSESRIGKLEASDHPWPIEYGNYTKLSLLLRHPIALCTLKKTNTYKSNFLVNYKI